ncbi:MAG: hypothetical protein OXF26_13420 [Alphaproteobacteria bacterium]|nr:hypothetical protein [Alphaproteobacteria bacterium]
MKVLEAPPDGTVLFVDPPYTIGGKRAGMRLYTHNDIDYARLFEQLADVTSDFLMTYDQTPEIEAMVFRHGFHARCVTMKNTYRTRISELTISRHLCLPCK